MQVIVIQSPKALRGILRRLFGRSHNNSTKPFNNRLTCVE